MHFFWMLFFCLVCGTVNGIEIDQLRKVLNKETAPFTYDLHLKVLQGNASDQEVLIALHGMGSDSSLADVLKQNPVIPFHIVSFNFPDVENSEMSDIRNIKLGTIDEILPFLYLWKKIAVDGGAVVHLYGFSAGGGALVNAVALLNSNPLDKRLEKIGITDKEKKIMLDSLQKGSVILEVPLKSFDEIADKYDRETIILASIARKNDMVPIDNVKKWNGLALNVFVYFSIPDNALGNRDDKKFLQQLREANSNGKTVGIIARSGGHTAWHPELWDAYAKFLQDRKK